MEASLTCAVCLSLFEEPVTLPGCSHNFCRPCVAECLGPPGSPAEASSASASRPPPPPRRPPDPPRESGPAPVTVPCPLCRKLSPLPPDGGAAALPVNTTLAEVVKLFRASSVAAKPGREATPEEASSALAPQLASLGGTCKKHPGRSLQLYCRRCLRGACGQCVSEEHQGSFHAVNLIDTVYQEEKLAFFSNLKKIRDLHENLIKEMSVSPNDARVVMLNEEEIIKTEFEKVYNALEVRKKQLLEEVEAQKNRKLKESLIWKRMKEVHKKTIENVLNDCEKLLNIYDPQRFLEVSCNLNQRMKTQLDLMQIACSHENQSECKQIQMDTTDIVNDILALNLTALSLDAVKDIPSRVLRSISARPGNQWKVQENVQKTFYPVPGEDIVLDNGRNIPTQYMSLSAATEFGNISHEEMRYNYYMKHQVCLDELQAQTSPQKENHSLLKCLSSKSTTSGVVLSCLSAEGKSKKKLKVPSLRRPCFNEAGLSNSVGFTFDAQAVNLNFCGSRSKMNLHNVNQSQNDAKETSLSALSNNCQNTTKSLQSQTGTLHSEGLFSFTRFPVVPESAASASVATVKPYVPGASSLTFGPSDSVGITAASKASPLIFEKDKEVFSTVSPKRCDNQDCNLRNNINGYNCAFISAISPRSDAANSGSPFLSGFPDNSESDSCQTTTVNSSEEKPFSCLIADQKILQENKAVCLKKLTNKGNSWFTSSANESNKHLVCNSNDTFPMACTTSTAYMIDAAKKQPVCDSISSTNDCCKTGTPCLFSFKVATKNCDDTLTSIKSFNKPECVTEKSKMKSKDRNVIFQKSAPSKKDVASYKELKDIKHSFSFVSINKSPKAESCGVLFPQQIVSHDLTTNSNSVSIKIPERENPLEIPPPAVEDNSAYSSILDTAHSTVNPDSDVEDLSQISNVSDSSSTSEYFSVTEDKISS
ncbi:hypothetical protein JRQ81_016581 [Phrynocephalus forsythii]|uniref:Uncharacterized protein n=1 Tax=Phrynocephalus forsythii TaxID=171643 RepID=A0A9Q0XUI1_9SAUR|nr:hypothetical protein JRQ81_016581 [Phrynocephalus forsythii]